MSTGPDVTWKCTSPGCAWQTKSDNLRYPIMHEVQTGHKTEPTSRGALAWRGLL